MVLEGYSDQFIDYYNYYKKYKDVFMAIIQSFYIKMVPSLRDTVIKRR